MDYEKQEVIQLLKKLVNIESTNVGTYEGAVGEFVYNWLQNETCGTNAKIFKEEVLPGRNNIIAYLDGETDHPNMVLIAHMDTVPVGNGWTKDPFAAEIENGKMYGRGTCDMKSGLAAAMISFRDAARSGKRRKHSLVFIGSVDEENVMSGSMHAVKKGWIRKDSWVLDTEPSGGNVIGSHKGKCWFRITTEGRPAHSSVPEMGVDAIAAMGEIVHELQCRMEQCIGTTPMGVPTICYGNIQGGTNINIVSDRCELLVDMRLTPPFTEEDSVELVKAAIAAGTARVKGSVGKYEILSKKPYVVLDESSVLLKNVMAAAKKVCGKEPMTCAMAGYTDSGVAAAETGCIDAMSYGALGGNIHQADEWVDCSSVVRLKDVLGELLEAMVFDQP